MAGSRASAAVVDAVAHATGRARRSDPELPRTGGPAGNAQLTAWLGLLLLALSLAEVVTLLSVRRLITWHIAIGVLLIPPALLKIGTTTWRVVRYYSRSTPYRQAGPPPLLLRLLGPMVVASTVAVLATGTLLIGLGQTGTRRPLLTVAGHDVSWLTLHQGSFIVWGVTTGLHVLGRFVPSLQLARNQRGTRHDGTRVRAVALLTVVAAATVLAYVIVDLSGSWTSGVRRDRHRDEQFIGRP